MSQHVNVQVEAAEGVVRNNMREYGMYVVHDRAIPDAVDGLKPVQRRILYAMNCLGLKPGSGSLKCAKIVGETMGSYHPHGDSSIYGALTSLAVPWSTRYPLVKPQGNFGGVMGDPPAAYRYTEAGFTELGFGMFLDKKYLKMVPNYDGSHEEPETLSSPVPTILIEGYSGIAMGFSGNIPSHDIVEILQAAKNNLAGKPAIVSGPQLKLNCFLTSSQDKIQELYTKGEGTLYYTSAYTIDEKNKSIMVTGFAPGVSLTGLRKDLSDLISKELIWISDDTAETISIEISFKDTRLLKSRVISALSSSGSYQFHALDRNSSLKLYSLQGLLDVWQEHRLDLWAKRIADNLAIAKREQLELQTQLAIIRNLDKWAVGLQLLTMAKVKAAVTEFIDASMFDYALDLSNRKIMKLNEDMLAKKIKEVEQRIKRWADTTPKVELSKQLDELIETYEALNIPKSTLPMAYDELPNFESHVAQTNWMVLSDTEVAVSTDAPTRGRGFASTTVGKCLEWFNIVSTSGWIEQHSVFHMPKRFGFQEWQSKPLCFVPEGSSIIVGLDVKGSMHARVNSQINKTYQALTKDIRLQRALFMTPNDILVIRYKDGRFSRLTYDKVMNRTTTRGTQGTPEYWGPNNIAVDLHLIYKDGFGYTSDGVIDTAKLKNISNVKFFDLGEENFVVLKTGQRQILDRKSTKAILNDVELVVRLRG